MDLIKKKYIDTKPVIDKKKLTREEIVTVSRIKDEYNCPFHDFQKVVLDFQLRNHDKFLKNFIYIFKKADVDNNGIISEEEFANLVNMIGVYREDFNEQVSRLLHIIDPFNKQQIIFSDCVSLFAAEIIEEDDGQGNIRRMSLLERISIDDSLLNI